jgi:hypothetical protein
LQRSLHGALAVVDVAKGGNPDDFLVDDHWKLEQQTLFRPGSIKLKHGEGIRLEVH